MPRWRRTRDRRRRRRRRRIFLDVNARVQMQAVALGGTVTYLRPQDIAPPGANYARSWGFWKQRAMGK
jgi:hypothetical protein